MLGVELVDRFPVEDFVSQCLSRGVLLGWTLHSSTLVRVAPPLNIESAVLDNALSIVSESLDTVEPRR